MAEVTGFACRIPISTSIPPHFLAAGLYALLCLHLRRQPRFLAVLGVLLAAAPFWSAFVAVGLLPLLAVLLWMNGVRAFLRWPNVCVASRVSGGPRRHRPAGTAVGAGAVVTPGSLASGSRPRPRRVSARSASIDAVAARHGVRCEDLLADTADA